MTAEINKRALVDQVLASLRHEVEVLLAAARATHEGATHEENRPENDKDTRAIEAGYLAGAQAARVGELRAAADAVAAMPIRAFASDDAVSISALVQVDVGGARSSFFVVPAGGGLKCEIDGGTVQAVTPRSPVGAALLGHCAGDVVDVQTQGGVREYEIVRVE